MQLTGSETTIQSVQSESDSSSSVFHFVMALEKKFKERASSINVAT